MYTRWPEHFSRPLKRVWKFISWPGPLGLTCDEYISPKVAASIRQVALKTSDCSYGLMPTSLRGLSTSCFSASSQHSMTDLGDPATPAVADLAVPGRSGRAATNNSQSMPAAALTDTATTHAHDTRTHARTHTHTYTHTNTHPHVS